MRLSRVQVANVVSPFVKVFCSVVVLRIELSATWISAGFGQPALDYQALNRDGRTRTDTIVFPKHVGLPLPNIPLLFVYFFSSSYGSRTHLSALKGQYPHADRRTSHVVLPSARTLSAVGREALESSSPGFQPSAKPSQLPTQRHVVVAPIALAQQKTRCPCDTGPWRACRPSMRPSVTSAFDARRYYPRAWIPAAGNNSRICILEWDFVVNVSWECSLSA
jgi:hypothetical protein